MSKLNKKHKSKVRRQVNLDLGVKPPKTIIFTSTLYNIIVINISIIQAPIILCFPLLL